MSRTIPLNTEGPDVMRKISGLDSKTEARVEQEITQIRENMRTRKTSIIPSPVAYLTASETPKELSHHTSTPPPHEAELGVDLSTIYSKKLQS